MLKEMEMPVAVVSNKAKAEVKRTILAMAAKMSSSAIDGKVNMLLQAWRRAQESGASSDDIELEMQCWSELWLSRQRKG